MTAPPSPFPVEGGHAWALFLDVDGTLADIAAHPDCVRMPVGLPTILTRLQLYLNGAVAVVSGRSLRSIDRLIEMPYLDAAGCHGGEFRISDCSIIPVHLTSELRVISDRLSAVAVEIPGVHVEHKPRSVAFHYRQSDLSANDARAIVVMATEGYGEWFRILMGRCVVEVLPAGIGKGNAIAKFMERPPYEGRMPVFVGDDLTDEEGFEEVNRRGGLSIHVGSLAPTMARWRLESPSSVLSWLRNILDTFEKERAEP